MKWYILKDKRPVRCHNALTWARWCVDIGYDNRIKYTELTLPNDNSIIRISTIFLYMDYSHFDNSRPILFETMVFGGKLDDEGERYSTYEEAEKGHDEMVKKVKEAEGLE